MFKKYIVKTLHRIILEQLLIKESYRINSRILDIGSKNRRYDHIFNGKIIAVDIKPQREKGILFGDIENRLDFSDNSFDGILCLEVIEYLERYNNALKEIYRLLKKDGWAIISIPFMYHDHGDKLRFTRVFMESKLQQAGFSEIGIKKIGNAYTVIWDILRKKVLFQKNRLVRYLLFPLIIPYFVFMKLFQMDKIQDEYYSGLFFFITK